ncbi:AAA family ATPase [Neptuniibacter caesariensis]|uniref:histidine kinase n=1 Tax=Neptuniibacter caesariensis TaxID=207954 RepID=A0A7U8C3Y1_NEPCE|nr:AAA family ATPase [Neptuniibacter caesariensis]EAR59994.1 serine/threonine kinase with two-component sensor domain [Oceanospirillum sp. MED92] [Neptuniibacter caesariensis]
MPDRLHIIELLHQGKHSRISRAIIERNDADKYPVIVKQAANEQQINSAKQRLAYEFSLLSQLQLDCICRPIELRQTDKGHQILFQDIEAVTLRQWMLSDRPELVNRISAALNIAKALGKIHDAEIIHKQITPDNILIDPQSLNLWIIDFSLSSRLQREHPGSISGLSDKQNLAYISPEQTGRINRVIDYRSDYYGLGATLYELFTGATPFISDDSLELIHCHLARQPVEPYIQNTDLPEPLSQVIMKLLAKDASQRYQSSFGLCNDLNACLEMTRQQRKDHFTVGCRDISERFELPQKLYGRENVVAQLQESFDAACRGQQSLALISGYAGIGKSSVAHEMRHYITQRRGLFASGKFDQYHRNRPYTAIYQALQILIRQLLTESDEQIAQWRERLLEATGNNAQVLFRLIPELELILGKQPSAPKLSPSEEQHRFSHIIRQLLKVFATEQHPLVLFFDDLHWADLSSLKLLDKLSHNPQHPHLLVIGSYRTQNFSNNHPFNLAIEHLKKAPVKQCNVEIQPLTLNDITALVADTLGQHSETCQELAEICFSKTQGNPFFLNQFLIELYDKQLISFQGDKWVWTQQDILDCEITDNVIDFMVDKLQRLPPRTLEALKLAACIGNPIPLQILASAFKHSVPDTADALWPALKEGLLLPTANIHQYKPEGPVNNSYYRFVHDRVQQAAYSMIPDQELETLHYQIGNVLKESMSIKALGRRLFDVTNHLNQSLSLISTTAEKLELAELNLKTGIRARESAAFESAFEYFQQGLALFAGSPELRAQELKNQLFQHAAETAYIKADFEYLDRLLSDALPGIPDLHARIQLEELRIQALVAQNRFSEALETALGQLSQLKIQLPLSPKSSTITLNQVKTYLLLNRFSDERILKLPKMKDPNKLATMSLLANMFGVVKFSSSGLRPLVMAKEVELTLKHGLSNESAMAFAGYGGVLCGKNKQIELGLRLGRLALKICDRYPNNREHRVQSLYNAYIRHYAESLSLCAASLFESHLKALEYGDIEWSAYSLAAYIQYEFALTSDLGIFADQLKQYILQLNESGQIQSLHYTLMTQQCVATLIGPEPAGLNGKFYDEAAMLAEYQANNHKTAICLHFYYKAVLALIYGQHDQAEQFFAEANEYSPYISGTYTAPYLEFFSTVNSLLQFESTSVLEQSNRIKKAKKYLKKLRQFCQHSRENHLHHEMLIKALILTCEARYSSAIDFFDQAANHAESYNFNLDHALCMELTAHCYRQWKKETLYQHYIKQAAKRYAAWGASSKVRQLEESYSFLTEVQVEQRQLDTQTGSGSEPYLQHRDYDITSVIKASQAISDEIMLEPLISTLIRLAIVNAGAQRAVLLLNHEHLTISAEATIEADTRFYDDLPLNQAADILPSSIIHYVARTKENVVLGDATKHEMFQQDQYIQGFKPRSLLALPILYHSELTAILYLENNQSSNVFDRNRLETLQILAAQAAISIENAKLYQSLEQSEYDYKSLFLNAVEGIFRASPDGHFLSANPALATLLGYRSMDEFHDEITDIASQCFYVDHERVAFLEKLDTQHKILNFETRWRKKSGEPIYVSLSARKVLDASGQVQYYEGSLTDITERKAKEAAEQARHEAEAENEAKSMFLATMSHEIRTPMNGILGMAQLMKQGQLNSEQNEQIDTIYNAGQTLLSILNNILDYSKIESGQLELEEKPFLIQDVMDEIYNLFKPVAQEKSLQIVPNIERTLPAVSGDPRVLSQILMNLCSNALKFTHQGYIRISCEGLPDTQDKLKTRFTIEDTGIGIPEKAQSRIFQHFTQADSSITRRYGGTGLGLAITRQIIERLNGEIGFESTEEQGTTFWFELSFPITDELPAEVANVPMPKPSTCLDILLVEDTPVNQEVTKGLLESDGHKVSIADDGYTALSMHNDHDYDLVLMDIHLPDMDGMETTRRMREHPQEQKSAIRIIALTASVTPNEVQNYLDSGMNGVLAKPIQHADLKAILEQEGTTEVKNTATQEYLDLALLTQHREMLGEESVQQLLTQFHNQAEQLLEEIAEAIQQQDSAALQSSAHTLSGAAANFGFIQVQQAAKALEKAGSIKSDNHAELQSSCTQLNETYHDSRIELNKWTDITQ